MITRKLATLQKLAPLALFQADELCIPCGISPIYVYIEYGETDWYYAIDHANHTEFARTVNEAAAIINRLLTDYPISA